MIYIRIFLGVIMIFLGLNKMFHIIPNLYLGLGMSLETEKVSLFFSLLMIFVGSLLIANSFVPVALLYGIFVLFYYLLFHSVLTIETILLVVFACLLDIVLIYYHRKIFIFFLGKNKVKNRI